MGRQCGVLAPRSGNGVQPAHPDRHRAESAGTAARPEAHANELSALLTQGCRHCTRARLREAGSAGLAVCPRLTRTRRQQHLSAGANCQNSTLCPACPFLARWMLRKLSNACSAPSRSRHGRAALCCPKALFASHSCTVLPASPSARMLDESRHGAAKSGVCRSVVPECALQINSQPYFAACAASLHGRRSTGGGYLILPKSW